MGRKVLDIIYKFNVLACAKALLGVFREHKYSWFSIIFWLSAKPSEIPALCCGILFLLISYFSG